jgi:hypothetical protein
MGLTKDQHAKLKDILDNVDPHIGIGEVMALHVKLLALQTNLLSQIVDELGSIDSSLNRIATRM